MSTKTENSKNDLYIFEKDGQLVEKVAYRNNLQSEINKLSGEKLSELIKSDDFDGFIKSANALGYRIYKVIEL